MILDFLKLILHTSLKILKGNQKGEANMSNVIVVNKSKDEDYNKQRDNQILPLSTCGPTSMAMALFQAGYRDWVVKNEDPADTITKELTTEQAFERMHNVIGTKETIWRPFNIHAVLTWGINNFLKKEVSTFRTDWTLQQILLNIIQGGGVVLVGDFTLPDGRELGHMVSLAGFETTQNNILFCDHPTKIDLAQVSHFIIDDPYGNYLNGYLSHHGMNVRFDYKLFYSIFRQKDSPSRKWAHLIKPSNQNTKKKN